MPILKPNPGQQEFALRQPYSIREVLYGGARGGGKTFAGLIWLTEYVDHPRFQGLVIRRNSDDLSDWIERARYMYEGLGGVITGNPAMIRFPSGAFIRTGHLKDDSTYTKYQGHEYQKILIEELTQIVSKDRYQKLVSSCRTSIPELKPQIFATTNPGGVGHLWVKELFIDPNDPNEPFVSEDGVKRIYIPATMDDNPVLQKNDPDYVQSIEALKYTDEALYKAWRHGDWNIFVGQVFKEWSHKHIIPKLPVDLTDCDIYIGFDWGFRDPASAHWIAVAPENEFGVKHAYIYREIYMNETRPGDWAAQIAEIVKDEPVEYLVMPHDTFSNLGGTKPITEQFQDVFDELDIHITMVNGEAKSHRAKINRQALLHDLLADSPDGTPYLQTVSSCMNLIRTVPALPYSDRKPEEIDENAEDHAYDSATYGLYFISEQDSYFVSPKRREPTFGKTPWRGNEDGTITGEGIDIGKILKENNGRTWKDM